MLLSWTLDSVGGRWTMHGEARVSTLALAPGASVRQIGLTSWKAGEARGSMSALSTRSHSGDGFPSRIDSPSADAWRPWSIKWDAHSALCAEERRWITVQPTLHRQLQFSCCGHDEGQRQDSHSALSDRWEASSASFSMCRRSLSAGNAQRPVQQRSASVGLAAHAQCSRSCAWAPLLGPELAGATAESHPLASSAHLRRRLRRRVRARQSLHCVALAHCDSQLHRFRPSPLLRARRCRGPP